MTDAELIRHIAAEGYSPMNDMTGETKDRLERIARTLTRERCIMSGCAEARTSLTSFCRYHASL